MKKKNIYYQWEETLSAPDSEGWSHLLYLDRVKKIKAKERDGIEEVKFQVLYKISILRSAHIYKIFTIYNLNFCLIKYENWENEQIKQSSNELFVAKSLLSASFKATLWKGFLL